MMDDKCMCVEYMRKVYYPNFSQAELKWLS